MKRGKLQSLGFGLSSLFVYYLLAFEVPRSDFLHFFGLYALVFGLFVWAIRSNWSENQMGWSIKWGLLFRILMISAIPWLSDDFYRYYWDGQILHSGLDPYAFLPAELVGQDLINSSDLVELGPIFPLLNSPEYYSVYPPISQGIFAFGASLAGGSLLKFSVILGAVLLFFEILNLALLRYLLSRCGAQASFLLLYALNPLVVIECCGNLHFEGAMLLSLLACSLLAFQKKWFLGGVYWAFGIGTKLFPLVLAPLFWKLEYSKFFRLKSLYFQSLYFLLWGTLLSGLFLILVNGNLSSLGNIWQSVSLYSQKFEFNAGLYYALREIGLWISGYNLILYIGTATALMSLIWFGLLAYRFQRDKMGPLAALYLALLVYLLLANNVQPWYLVPLLGLGSLVRARAALVWSFLIMLSYSAYRNEPQYQEMYVLIALEYLVLLPFVFQDLRKLWSYRF